MTMIVESSKMIDERAIYQSEGRIVDYMKVDIAKNIGTYLLKEGFINFETKENNLKEDYFIGTKLTGFLGVSTHDEVKALKQQLDKARLEAAEEAFDKLLHMVNIWGSHYGDTTIRKSDVSAFVGKILRDMKND